MQDGQQECEEAVELQQFALPRAADQDRKILRFEDNDSGHAEKFLYLYSRELAFCGRTRTWYVYDGKRWLEDKNGHEVRRKLESFYRRVMRIFDAPDLLPEQASRKKALLRLGNCNVREHLLLAAEAKSRFDSKCFNQMRTLLVADNAIVDLPTGLPQLFSERYLLTQKTELSYKVEAEPPARFLRFLQEVFSGDRELIAYVQKVLGYCLTGETREQCFFIFCGAGSNGKSVLLNLLQRMLPEYVQTLALSGAAEKRDYGAPNSSLVAAQYARMLLVHELNNNTRLDENLFKTSTGEDMVMARAMYQSEIEFRPQYKLVLTVNHFPQVDWEDYAMERRIRLIPFLRTFKGRAIDKQLPQKLWQEREAILRWLVQGAERWYAEGLGPQPELVKRQLWQLQMASTSFCDFYERCLEFTGCEEDAIQASTLYQSYCDWCRRQDLESRDVLGTKKFSQNLLRNKITKKLLGRSRCNYYLGVRFKDIPEQEPAEEPVLIWES